MVGAQNPLGTRVLAAAPPASLSSTSPQIPLQQLNEPFFRELDSMAFDYNGNNWSRQARLLAFKAICHATDEAVAINSGHKDDTVTQQQNLQTIAAGDHQLAAVAEQMKSGKGDYDHWTRSIKQLAMQIAYHTCTAATLCDGAMLKTMLPYLDLGLRVGHEKAFTGAGEAKFWHNRTEELSNWVSGSCASGLHLTVSPSPAQAGAPSALQQTMMRLNTAHMQDLEDLSFNFNGNEDSWRVQARLTAFRTVAHSARTLMEVASQRQDTPEVREANLAQIRTLNNKFALASRLEASSTGAQTSRIAKHVALRAAEHICAVAGLCDANMMENMRPYLEDALQTADANAFHGSGGDEYWRERAHTVASATTNFLHAALGEPLTAAVPPPPQPAVTPTLVATAAAHEMHWKGMIAGGHGRSVVGIVANDRQAEKGLDGYLEPYVKSVLEAGGEPRLVFPSRAPLSQQMAGIDALLVPGGADIHPVFYGETVHAGMQSSNPDAVSDAFGLACVRAAYRENMPLLGICRGQQLMVVADQGRLVQDLPTEQPSATGLQVTHARDARNAHTVMLVPQSRLQTLLGKRSVMAISRHHQAAMLQHAANAAGGPPMVGLSLAATAFALDGTVEAVERLSHPTQHGVQFHAEGDPNFRPLFEDLVANGEAFRAAR